MYRVCAALFGLTIAAANVTAVQAAGRPASFVVDANSGAVISAFNADEPRYPASLTKMMTLYIAFDLMQQGRLGETTRIRMSPRAASAQPTKLGIEAGSDLALVDAIKSLITLSANDVAIAIAEHIAGTEEKFADLMTQKARAIGMKNTVFKNASGLPNSEQVTTARDMVTLGLRLQDDFPKYYPLFATRDFRYAGRNHVNHNTLLNSFEGTEGIKTGYTSASGFNLVASVKRGSKHVVGSVFGGASASSRNQTMRTLLQMALFKASSTKTRIPTASAAIARARPSPEPRPEARPAQQVAAAALKPSIAPTNWPSATPAPDTRPQLDVARVRPVLVAPRPSRQAPTEQLTALPPIPPPVRVASAAPMAPAPVEASRPILVSQPPLMAAGLAPGLPASRGNPPSSFQQQAANLSGGAALQPRPPVASRPAIGQTDVQIQIGAYASAAEADRQLVATRQKAADLLGNAQASTQQTSANGKILWRARFSGFQAANAGTVCTELRRRQIDCLVAKAE